MRFASAGFRSRSYVRAQLDPTNQISRFTKLKLVICARTGDRAGLVPHGSGALVTPLW